MTDVFTDAERARIDSRPDAAFYEVPRFVTHADDAFLARLTELYERVLAPGDRVFDAMSSWVSHLPDYTFERVIGHGLNAEELAANDRLDVHFIQDLNAERSLPIDDHAVDAVLCALSVQYLQYPGAVFAEFRRVLRPGGTLVVSFTNRMFPAKAIRAWREASMDGRVDLVRTYLNGGGGFDTVEEIREQPGTDPFYAVVARR